LNTAKILKTHHNSTWQKTAISQYFSKIDKNQYRSLCLLWLMWSQLPKLF